MKKANNRILIALLAGLIFLFFTVKYFRSSTLQGNLPENLSGIDTAKVTEIRILPGRARGHEVRLIRNGKEWELGTADRKGHLEQGAGPTAMRSLIYLRPQRLVSKKKEKWNDFNVDDSTGTKVKVMAGDAVEAELVFGRTGFSQSSGGMFSGSAYTYVRRAKDSEVYTVEGFLESQFNRSFDDWRDKSFLRLKRDSIDRIEFHYPSDSSFVLEKKEGRWLANNAPADSAAVVSFVTGLEFKNMATFSSDEPVGEGPLKVIFSKGTRTLSSVEGWPGPGSWILRSSLQPDTWFSSEESSLRKDFFRGRKSFLKARK